MAATNLRSSIVKPVLKLPRAPRAGERRSDLVAVRALTRATINPKTHDNALIRASFRRHGYADQIVVDERTKELISGNGRLEVLADMEGARETPPDGIQVIDGVWHVPVTRGWRSRDDDHARGYIVTANKSSEVGGWDAAGYADLARSLDEDIRRDSGITDEEYAQIVRESAPPDLTDTTPGQVPDSEPPGYDDVEDQRRFRCPACSHEWSGSPRPADGPSALPIPDYDNVFPRVPDA